MQRWGAYGRYQELDGGFGAELHRTAPEIEVRYAGSRIRPGDLLLSIKATVGEVGLVPAHLNGNISRDLARIRCGPDLDPRVLLHLFRSERYRAYMNKHVVGSTRKEISIHALRKFEVPLPPRDESERFILVVGQLEAAANVARLHVKRIAEMRRSFTDVSTAVQP